MTFQDVNLEQVGNERHTNSVVDGALTSRCVENICGVRVSQDSGHVDVDNKI